MLDKIVDKVSKLDKAVERLRKIESPTNSGDSKHSAMWGTNLYQGKQYFNVTTGQWEFYEPGYTDLPPMWYKAGVGGYDDFTRTNDATTAGKLVSGMAWIPQLNGGGIATLGINSNRFYFASDANSDTVHAEMHTNQQTLEVTVNAQPSNATNFRVARVLFNVIDPSNYLAVQLYNGNLYFFKIDGGVLGTFATVATTTSDGTDYRITVVPDGIYFSIFVNGFRLVNRYKLGTLAVTDVKFMAGTKIGMQLAKGGAPSGTATSCKWGPIRVRQLSRPNSGTMFYDLFNRADEVPATTPDFGPSYDNANTAARGYAPLSIKNQKMTFVFGTLGGSTFGSSAVNMGSADVYYRAKINTISGRVMFYVRAYYDAIDNDIYGYYFEINQATDNKGRLYWYHNDGTTAYVYTLLGISPHDIANGDTIEFITSGTHLAVLHNSQAAAGTSEANFGSNVICGVSIINDFTAKLDHLYIQPI